MDRILYVGMNERKGGIETFIRNVYDKFDREKINVDFIKYADLLVNEKEFSTQGSKFYQIRSRSANPFLYLWQLIKFFLKHPEYKIVHHHLNSCSSVEAVIIAKLFGRKNIVHSHNQYQGKNSLSMFLHYMYKPLMNICADQRLACSNVAGEWMFGKRKFEIIRNGIDTDTFGFEPRNRDILRSELGIGDRFVVGHVGEFKYQKNHDFILKIFSELVKVQPKALLLLVGDGILKPQIQSKAKALNLDENIIFTGSINNVADFFLCMDIFILPSHFEGLPFVAVEAQSTGLPCVISDVVSNEVKITDLVQMLSLTDSPQKWAHEILGYHREAKPRESHAKEVEMKGYSSVSTAKILEDIYITL